MSRWGCCFTVITDHLELIRIIMIYITTYLESISNILRFDIRLPFLRQVERCDARGSSVCCAGAFFCGARSESFGLEEGDFVNLVVLESKA